METHAVAASQGWQWIVEGFRLFRRQPLIWMLLLAAMAVIWLASTILQPVGPLAISLLSPVFVAGLMNACRETDRGGEPDIGHLFSAFRTHAAPLVTIGGVYLVGNIIAVGVVFMVSGGDALNTLLAKGRSEADVAAAIRGLSFGLVVGTAVFIPVVMAVWFAPLLVVFHNAPPVAALQSSFAASWQNMLPFTVYGCAMLVLWILASIPLMLGFIVLLPVMVCSIYVGYKDIYAQHDIPAAPEQTNG
jgi:uncharacterized membrane protein